MREKVEVRGGVHNLILGVLMHLKSVIQSVNLDV